MSNRNSEADPAFTSSGPEPTEQPENLEIAAAAPPVRVAKAKRSHRRKIPTLEIAVDATPAPEPTAAPEGRSAPSGEEIAATCRRLLFDYLTGAADLPPLEAKAAADRAVRALASPAACVTRADTKLARLTSLLHRRQGATIAEMVEATGWQAHSVRGALSGTLKKRMGLAVTSEAAEGGRVYRLPAEG